MYALGQYFGTEFQPLNNVLRGIAPPTPKHAELIDAIDSAFQKAPRLPFDVLMFRAINIRSEQLADVLNDPAFKSMSVSTRRSWVRGLYPSTMGDVKLKVRVPAGTRYWPKLGLHTYGRQSLDYFSMDAIVHLAKTEFSLVKDRESELLLPRCVRFELLESPLSVVQQQLHAPSQTALALSARAVCVHDEVPGDWRILIALQKMRSAENARPHSLT